MDGLQNTNETYRSIELSTPRSHPLPTDIEVAAIDTRKNDMSAIGKKNKPPYSSTTEKEKDLRAEAQSRSEDVYSHPDSASISQELDADDPSPKSSQEKIMMETTREDMDKIVEEQGTHASNASPSTNDATLSKGRGTISPFCSPMGTSDRNHEVYALSAASDQPSTIGQEMEGALERQLTFVAPQPTRSSHLLDLSCPAETKNISGARDDFQSHYLNAAPSMLPEESTPPSSPISLEPHLFPSSPLMVLPSSPPTSSPPPVSSRTPSPSGIKDNGISQFILTELPNLCDSKMQDRFPMAIPAVDDFLKDISSKSMAAIPGPNSKFEQGNLDREKCVPPNPKRPTAFAHRKQQEKLSKPFRSPRLVNVSSESAQLVQTNSLQEEHNGVVKDTRTASQTMRVLEATKQPQRVREDGQSKHGATRATAQFRSPLISSGDASRTYTAGFRLTPAIQVLERKLQILKRAVKIKEDDQEDILQGLVTKWTEAGQEIAWELWEVMKDNMRDSSEYDYSAISGKKRPFQDNWNWEMGNDKRQKADAEIVSPNSEIADHVHERTDTMGREVGFMKTGEDDEPESHPCTLGTMLRHLGIDPQTLGWDDEEETFKDFGEV